jgi:hypothetical protein
MTFTAYHRVFPVASQMQNYHLYGSLWLWCIIIIIIIVIKFVNIIHNAVFYVRTFWRLDCVCISYRSLCNWTQSVDVVSVLGHQNPQKALYKPKAIQTTNLSSYNQSTVEIEVNIREPDSRTMQYCITIHVFSKEWWGFRYVFVSYFVPCTIMTCQSET